MKIFKDRQRKRIERFAKRLAGTPVKPEVPQIPCPWSEYLDWLSFANAGMLGRGNVYCMDYAISHLPSAAPIVEIGSFAGLSTNALSHLKQKYSVRNHLITCDKWLFEGATPGALLADSQVVSHADYRAYIKTAFLQNVRMFSRQDLPWTIEALSDEFFAAWSRAEKRQDVFGREIQLGGPISFCYIDGNHSYEFAKRDFGNADAYLERGGFVLFDDSADGSAWEVTRVVQEVAESGRYELVTKNPNYLFRKK